MNIEKSILDKLIGIIDTDPAIAIANCGYIFLQLHTPSYVVIQQHNTTTINITD